MKDGIRPKKEYSHTVTTGDTTSRKYIVYQLLRMAQLSPGMLNLKQNKNIVVKM